MFDEISEYEGDLSDIDDEEFYKSDGLDTLIFRNFIKHLILLSLPL